MKKERLTIKEQLYILFGALLWVLYIVLSEDRTGPYAAISAAIGYVAVWCIATGAYVVKKARSRPDSDDKEKE